MTKYLILRRSDQDPLVWVEGQRLSAISTSQAVKKACQTEPATGEFVAVPERSWKPVKVRMEQVSRVVLGEAKEPGEPA